MYKTGLTGNVVGSTVGSFKQVVLGFSFDCSFLNFITIYSLTFQKLSRLGGGQRTLHAAAQIALALTDIYTQSTHTHTHTH